MRCGQAWPGGHSQAERWDAMVSDGEAAHRMSARALGVNLVFIRSQKCGGWGECVLCSSAWGW